MSALIVAARRYLGVPFRHRGRTAKGLDCAGLGWVAYRDCGVPLPDFRLYGAEPHDDGLVKHLAAALGDPVFMAPVSTGDLQVGDVLVFRFEKRPHHVGLVGDYRFGGLSLIHADGHNRRVLEHRLSEDMVQRVTHVFRRPV